MRKTKRVIIATLSGVLFGLFREVITLLFKAKGIK